MVVTDDGVGGAALDNGAGIQGLEDRVGALSGSLGDGEPPAAAPGCRIDPADRAAEEAAARGDRPRVLSAEEADAIQGERGATSGLRGSPLGIVAGVLIGIWALTGPHLPWIVWPLLGHRADRGARRVADPRRRR